MRKLFSSREKLPFRPELDPRWDGGTLSAADVRKGKLAFATLLVVLLSITVSYDWNARARLIDRTPRETFIENLEMLGEQCIAEEDYLEAIVIFETLLEASPESPFADEALCRVGLCWLCLDNKDGAIEAWERFLRLYPDSEYAPKVRRSYLIMMTERSDELSA